MPIGLYVHIPFCARKCHYCNFTIALSGNPRLNLDYFRALEAETAEAHRRYGPIVFDTVYLGGGTPSALSIGEMNRLFALLRRNFSWKPDAEITCEVNPGEVDAGKLESYRRHGVNRISLGVQSTNDRLLKAMNRAHSADDARRTASAIKEAGYDNISMDLIIRLPDQEVEDVSTSIAEVVEWGTHQVVIYDLAVHENSLFGNQQKKGILALPSEEIHQQMFAAVESGLGSAGFEHYEVATFAKPGFQSRHNLIYWHNQPYLGLGPGAFSYIEGVRSVYAQTVDQYLEKTRRQEWSRDEEDALDPIDQAYETLLTRVRLAAGLDLSEVPLIRDQVETELPELAAQGLVEYDGRVLRLTRKGRYLAESVFSQLSQSR